ncbi:MAG: TPM domain-containing protein [Pseudomonadales bacterium]
MTLLTEQEAQQVAEAISKVEAETDAELVTVLAKQADDYHYIPTLWAALIALMSPGVVMFTPFWLDVTEVMLIQLVVFLVMAGLLRIPSIMSRIIPSGVKEWRAANLARRQFLDNNLHHTVGETAVMLFVSETEHYVEIIADRGISQFVDDMEWQQIVDEFTAFVRQGNTLEGFLTAVDRCGELLIKYVPATGEKNELPNHMILL